MNTELEEKMQNVATERFDDGRQYICFLQGAEWMYSELAPLVDWISVKERLPGYGNMVLVKNKAKGICIEFFYEKFNKNVTHWRRIAL